MKRRLAIGALVAAVTMGGSLAHAAVILPFAGLQVGDQTFNLNLIPDPSKSDRFFFDETFGGDEFEVTVTGTLDPDPMVAYGLTVSNFGPNPLAVTLTVGVGFAPLAASSITSGITGTLTPAEVGPLGLALNPFPGGVVSTSTDGAVSLGVDVGLGALLVSNLPALYGPFTGGPVAGPPGLSALLVTVGLQLTGDGDTAALTGSTIVTAVPEPAIVAIVGLGLFAGLARNRIRRSAKRE